MENASKALLMAGGVLIGVVIISLAVYLFVNFSNSTANMQKQMEDSAIQNFNNQFLAYDDKEDLTIYDISTVVNLAKDNNKKYELEGVGIEPGNFYIAVWIDKEHGNTGLEADSTFTIYKYDNKKQTIVDDNYYDQNGSGKLLRYKCQVIINETTSLVNKIIFTENTNYDYNT